MTPDLWRIFIGALGTVVGIPALIMAVKISMAAGKVLGTVERMGDDLKAHTQVVTDGFEKLTTFTLDLEKRVGKIETEREMAVRLGRRDTDIAVLTPLHRREAEG